MIITDNIFLELSKKIQYLGFEQSLIEISNIAFEEMPIDRLTIWKFTKKDILTCQFKKEIKSSSFDCCESVDLTKYPTYLKSITNEKLIVGNDVYNSKFMFELSNYYKSNNICSSLHIPIFIDNSLYGMVFFSTIDNYHTWKKEEIVFGSDISQIISIAYISSKRNEEIYNLNKYAEKIKSHNKDLQEIIKRKNEQFVEYGFINSHLLNAPFSRLKGLMNILVIEMNTKNREHEIEFIIGKIYEEYNDMDDIISQISNLINKGESLNINK